MVHNLWCDDDHEVVFAVSSDWLGGEVSALGLVKQANFLLQTPAELFRFSVVEHPVPLAFVINFDNVFSC